ncbi:MAG: cupin domain-containing protein [Gammaproteobacteria bacterium]|jgi:quercetin dioxygenase-like cupin family protein
MIRRRLIAATIAGAIAGFAFLAVIRLAQAQAGPEREFLLQEDLAIPGYQIVLTEATLAVGAREGRHTHPGTFVARLTEGELTLEREGRPTIILRPGDTVLVEPGQVHEGINTGSVPVKALVTFVVEKDKPLSIPATQ